MSFQLKPYMWWGNEKKRLDNNYMWACVYIHCYIICISIMRTRVSVPVLWIIMLSKKRPYNILLMSNIQDNFFLINFILLHFTNNLRMFNILKIMVFFYTEV